jgi:sulfoxide reductase heme-binding subunit YedZ
MDFGLASAHAAQQTVHLMPGFILADSATLWYLTRAVSVAAYVALTLSAVLGMLRGVARNTGGHLSWMSDELHQTLATLFGVLMLLHLMTLYFHTFIPFTLGNFLWIGSQPYRPFAVNLGVVAFYTAVAILVSTWVRRKIPYRSWRAIHYVSFATFVLVTLHGWLAGSDAGEPWMRAVYVGASCMVGFVALMRYLTRPRPEKAEDEEEVQEEETEGIHVSFRR